MTLGQIQLCIAFARFFLARTSSVLLLVIPLVHQEAIVCHFNVQSAPSPTWLKMKKSRYVRNKRTELLLADKQPQPGGELSKETASFLKICLLLDSTFILLCLHNPHQLNHCNQNTTQLVYFGSILLQ